MNDTANEQAMKQFKHVISFLPKPFFKAVLTLYEKLDDKFKWIINGDLAENLQVIQIEPKSIEILTTHVEIDNIHKALQEFNPSPIEHKTIQLSRTFEVNEKQIPVFTKGYFFEFALNGILVTVQGDLQYKVGNWDWGEIFDFDPQFVNVVGRKIPVTPIQIAYDLYQTLGWKDKVGKIEPILEKSKDHMNKNKLVKN